MNTLRHYFPKKDMLICLSISFLCITIFSRSSFLYTINPWTDANVFFTIGRSLLSGKLLYTDVFDHKGPFLYIIYSVASLISSRSFFGVYLLEIVNLFIFLIYSNKLLELFNHHKNYLFLSLLAVIICSCKAFSFGGGSVEEFTLPLIQISFYIVISTIRNGHGFPKKDCIILGTIITIIFLMKFTLCSFFVGFFITMAYYQYKTNRKELVSCIVYAFLPFFLINFFVILIFTISGNINDYFYTYYYLNIFSYGKIPNNIFLACVMLIKSFFFYWKENIFLISVAALGFVIGLKSQKNSYIRLLFISTLLSWYTITFISGIYFQYYILPIAVYIIYMPISNVNIKRTVTIPLTTIIIMLCTMISSNIPSIGDTDSVQNIIIHLLETSSNSEYTFTLYHGTDEGFYLLANKLPECVYFTETNMQLSDYDSVVQDSIAAEQYDYIISANYHLNLDDYYLYFETSGYYNNQSRNYYVYRRKATEMK